MATMNDIDPSLIFALFKGEPGTRKSTAALSFPKPQYWFSFDQKMESLLLPMRAWGINPSDVVYDDYKGKTGYNDIKRKLEALQVSAKPYRTIILDSITSIGDSINRQTLQVKSTDGGKKIAGISVNSIEDFNAEASGFQEILALCKDIKEFSKINIILIAHVLQTEFKSPSGQTHMSRTLVTGGKKAAAKIPAYCAEIYHFNIDAGMAVGQGGTYSILTTHTGDDFARTALPLKEKIIIGNDNLYEKYLVPAINQLKQPKVTL